MLKPPIQCLRELLLRGGYLVVDDFWGPEQWEIFRMTMDRVLPTPGYSLSRGICVPERRYWSRMIK